VTQETVALTENRGAAIARTAWAGLVTEVTAGGHAFRADEPESAGGTDTGPSPYELLAAALASCTSMTLQMYARRKGLDLQAATVRVRHSKIHALDCLECETREGRIDQFERTIELRGALSAQVRERLLEIADRCPVHRTLTREMRIVTSLVDAAR
jgi:uncharacterized OsmC-like protein